MKMAKRFTDTQIWEKEWFMVLSPKQKCFVKYVRDKCDIAGIWSPNYLLASFYIGEKVTEDELIQIDNGKQFKLLNDGKILCIDFVKFQYGSTLNPSSPIHRKVIDLLDKYQIQINVEEKEKTGFDAPTFDQVFKEFRLKLSESQSTIEANKFISFYESNGWKVGKNKMKSWKYAIAGWITRMKLPVQSNDIREKLKQLGNKKISEL